MPSSNNTPAQTPATRDAALRRLAQSRRWLLAGATALTGALTAVAANAFPGRTVKASSSHAGSAGAAPRTSAPSQGSGSEAGTSGSRDQPLQSPSHEPQASAPEGSPPGSEAGTESPPAGSQETAPSQPAQQPESTPSAPATSQPEASAPSTSSPEAPVVSGGS